MLCFNEFFSWQMADVMSVWLVVWCRSGTFRVPGAFRCLFLENREFKTIFNYWRAFSWELANVKPASSESLAIPLWVPARNKTSPSWNKFIAPTKPQKIFFPEFFCGVRSCELIFYKSISSSFRKLIGKLNKAYMNYLFLICRLRKSSPIYG